MKYDIQTIDEKVRWSRRQLEKTVAERKDAIKQFVGEHYADNGADKAVPTNMLEMAITIYLRLLAANAPKCSVSTEDPALKPFAYDFEIVLNQIPAEIGLRSTLRRAVLEAMFSMGIVKVGIANTSEDSKIGDEPFVSIVQMDDYFCDMSARSWNEVQYEGNDYWMAVEDVKERFGEEVLYDDYNGISKEGQEQAHSISVNESSKPLYDRVLLRDVYIAKTNELVTYAVETKKELRRVKWDGPEGTPYLKLWFNEVPGNLMPLAPVAIWQDLHVLGNQLFRKLANQGVSKKTVAVFSGGNDEEIREFVNAADGDAIAFSGAHPDEVTVGGVDNGNLAFFLSVWDRFSMICGNLDSLGGLSPQADTAAQDKLIGEAASARVRDMADRTVEFAQSIFRRLAWYVWTDPVRRRKYTKYASKKLGLGIRKEWTPETRDGDFLDYNFDISVFSMQDDSPAARLQKLANVFQTFILPLQPQFEAQGVKIDLEYLCDYIGANANIAELKNIIKFAQPQIVRPVNKAAGLPQPDYISTKPTWSKRVYERVNRPGATRAGKDAALMQTLLGGKAQGAEMAALARGIK